MPVSLKAPKKQSPLFARLSPMQQQGVLAAASVDGFAAFFAQRTGKTWLTCGLIEYRDEKNVLIVGPKTNLVSTWEKTLHNLLPHYNVFFSLDDLVTYQKAHVKKHGVEGYAILLLNYEALPAIIKRIKKRRWNLIVYDEAQRLKARTSKNSRTASTLVRISDHRIALTGTPLDKHPIDLWAIFRFIDPSLLGSNWKTFEVEFLEDLTSGILAKMKKAKGQMLRAKLMLQLRIVKNKPKFREDMWDEFIERIKPHTMAVTREDAGMKGAKITYVPVLLLGKQRRAYDQLEKTMVVDIGKKLTITTALKIVRNGKLQQITGGHIKDEEGRTRLVGAAKIRKLEHLLKRHKPPIAIFAKHTYDIEMILEVLADYSDRVGVVWGRVKDGKVKKPRTETIEAFQRGELDFIVCQQRTGGVGVDLFKARKAFVYSMGHSWIDYDQMISRLDFLNQTEAAEFFLLFAVETIDEDIITALKEKRSVSEVTLERLKHQP